MTNIQLADPQIEQRLAVYAGAHGTDIDGAVAMVLREHFHLSSIDPGDDEAEEAKRAEAIALLQSLLAKAPTDPVEVQKADDDFHELIWNLNNNRIMAGEEPLLP